MATKEQKPIDPAQKVFSIIENVKGLLDWVKEQPNNPDFSAEDKAKLKDRIEKSGMAAAEKSLEEAMARLKKTINGNT